MSKTLKCLWLLALGALVVAVILLRQRPSPDRGVVPATANYVATMPAGPLQPAAAASLAGNLAEANPQGAITWARSLATPAARDAATSAAFARWLDNAPDAARAWLATSSLSAETKARLTSPSH